MLISRLFRTPKNPRRVPVTDAHVSPQKNGTGILIRKIIRKRPLSSCQSANEEKNVAADRIEQSESDSINTQNSNEKEDVTEAELETATDKSMGTKNDDNSELPPIYLPRPGDLCIIRYDCFLLSNLDMDHDRHGRLRVSESQQLKNRRRKWVDGNFDEPPLTTASEGTTKMFNHKGSSIIHSDDVDCDEIIQGQPYSSVHKDPYCDGETSTRCPLKLPALEFEVGDGTVIRGLDVVVQRMVEGEVVEAIIPHIYAYGYQGVYPRIPPKADLLFIVELEKVIPSSANARSAMEGNETSNAANHRTQELIFYCCGLFEGAFMVLFGVAIPIFLCLRSELDLEEIIRELVGTPNR